MAKSAKRRITQALQTDTSTDGGRTAGKHRTAMSREDLKAVVKEGIAEGLEEHRRRTESDRQSDQASDSSSRSLVKLLGGMVVLGALAYVSRKRMSGSGDDGPDDYQTTHITTSPDGGGTNDEGTSDRTATGGEPTADEDERSGDGDSL